MGIHLGTVVLGDGQKFACDMTMAHSLSPRIITTAQLKGALEQAMEMDFLLIGEVINIPMGARGKLVGNIQCELGGL